MSKYVKAKVTNEEQSERNAQMKEELAHLRKLKKKLARDKDTTTHECDKLENDLHKSIKERTEIELQAQNLSQKLEQLQGEKEQLENEYNTNEAAIEAYNAEIRALKTELDNMKNVLSIKLN